MHKHASRWQGGDLNEHIKGLLEQGIPDCAARVAGHSGHFSIEVRSPAFEGVSLLNRQRMVYNALGDLMKGPDAPVHAVDQMIFHTA